MRRRTGKRYLESAFPEAFRRHSMPFRTDCEYGTQRLRLVEPYARRYGSKSQRHSLACSCFLQLGLSRKVRRIQKHGMLTTDGYTLVVDEDHIARLQNAEVYG